MYIFIKVIKTSPPNPDSLTGNNNWSNCSYQTPSTIKMKVKQKQRAYNLFIQLGLIAQGLQQYLAINNTNTIWTKFGSWLRTIRPNVLPSEKVVSLAMSKTYWEFFTDEKYSLGFKKFMQNKIDLTVSPELNLDNNLAA